MEVHVEHKRDKQGRRLHALRECFHRALKIALSCPTWEEFAVNFDNLPEHYVAGLFDLFQQVLHLTRANSEAEFEDICEESQLWSKLHTLEQLCQEQGLFGEHQDAARLQDRVRPAAIAKKFRVQAKQAEKAKLESMLHEIQEQEADLQHQLQQKTIQVSQAADRFQPIMDNLHKVHETSKQWASRPALQLVSQ